MDDKKNKSSLTSELIEKLGESLIKEPINYEQRYDLGLNTEALRAITKSNAEKLNREREDNENLKRIADAADDINSKFHLVTNDMEYILNSLGANFQRLEQLGREEKETLDQLLLALEYKNLDNGKSKIRDAIENKSIDVVLNAVIAYLQLKITGF